MACRGASAATTGPSSSPARCGSALARSASRLYVEPGSPWENGTVESFHSRLRDEFLALEQFENLTAARKLTAKWQDDYNHYRPRGSLGYLAPTVFADRCTASAMELASATPQPSPPLQQCSGVNLTETIIAGGTGI